MLKVKPNWALVPTVLRGNPYRPLFIYHRMHSQAYVPELRSCRSMGGLGLFWCCLGMDTQSLPGFASHLSLVFARSSKLQLLLTPLAYFSVGHHNSSKESHYSCTFVQSERTNTNPIWARKISLYDCADHKLFTFHVLQIQVDCFLNICPSL